MSGLTFGQRLRIIRESSFLSQEEAAGLCNLPCNTFAHYERERRYPWYHSLRKIIVGLSLDYEEICFLMDVLPRLNKKDEVKQKLRKVKNANLHP